MSSDLIAWIVAITLGLAVVGLGLRRDLGEVTRKWLPQFGEASNRATATPGPVDDGQMRRQLSPGQRRFAIWSYLLLGLCYAVIAILSADDRLLHASTAAVWATGAVVLLLKGDRRWSYRR
jgi:hypothetical protein